MWLVRHPIILLPRCFSHLPTPVGRPRWWRPPSRTIIQGLITSNFPRHDFQRWHGTVLVIAIMLFAILINTYLSPKLPWLSCRFIHCGHDPAVGLITKSDSDGCPPLFHQQWGLVNHWTFYHGLSVDADGLIAWIWLLCSHR